MKNKVANLDDYRKMKKCSCGRFILFDMDSDLCYYCVYDKLINDALILDY